MLAIAEVPLQSSLQRLLLLARAPERLLGNDIDVLQQMKELSREEKALELLASR